MSNAVRGIDILLIEKQILTSKEGRCPIFHPEVGHLHLLDNSMLIPTATVQL